jgi:hypothetical protein
MKDRNSEKIPLARLELRDKSLDTRIAVAERGKSLLELVAYDHATEEMFVGCFDKHQFAAFKEFLTDSESICSKLRTCPVLMPVDVIPNSMSLRIEVGSLELQNETVGCSLSIDRIWATEVTFAFSDNDSDGLVIIRLAQTDYRRFKDWILEAEQRLAELFKSGYLSQPFCG